MDLRTGRREERGDPKSGTRRGDPAVIDSGSGHGGKRTGAGHVGGGLRVVRETGMCGGEVEEVTETDQVLVQVSEMVPDIRGVLDRRGRWSKGRPLLATSSGQGSTCRVSWSFSVFTQVKGSRVEAGTCKGGMSVGVTTPNLKQGLFLYRSRIGWSWILTLE